MQRYLLDECSTTRNRKVVGSTPTSGSTSPQVRGLRVSLFLPWLSATQSCHRSALTVWRGEGGRVIRQRGKTFEVHVYAGLDSLTGKKRFIYGGLLLSVSLRSSRRS
jgi:hypothetical protein